MLFGVPSYFSVDKYMCDCKLIAMAEQQELASGGGTQKIVGQEVSIIEQAKHQCPCCS